MVPTTKLIYLRIAFGAALLMIALSFGVMGTSFFIVPVTEAFGFERAAFTVNYSLITFTALLTMPFIGRLVQRFGTRKPVFIGGIWAGLGYVGMSYSTTLPMFYLFGAMVGLVLFAVTNLMAIVVISLWFEKLRGLATGAVLACTGVGSVILGYTLPNFIEEYGWESGYLLVGAVVAGMCVVSAVFFLKDKPSDVGLLPYGADPGTDRDNGQVDVAYGVPYRAAVRSKEFVLLWLSIVLFMIATSDTEHLPAYFVGIGLEPRSAGTLMSIFGFALIILNSFAGFAADRFGVVVTMIAMLASGSAGWVLLLTSGTSYSLLALAVVLHTFAVSVGVLPALMTHRAFGQRDFPGIMGLMLTAGTVGLAIGAPVWGLVYDIWGGYSRGFYFAPIVYALAVVCVAVALRGARKKWGIQKPRSAVAAMKGDLDPTGA